MTAIAAGDYRDNQACGDGNASVGDTFYPCMNGAVADPFRPDDCLCTDLEDDASGVAPEVALSMAVRAGNGTKLANAYNQMNELDADVVNLSHHVEPNNGNDLDVVPCDIGTTHPFEEAVENLIDDGQLVVAAAGNKNLDVIDGCNVYPPGDMPGVLTVNAFHPDNTGCGGDYTRCTREGKGFAGTGGRTRRSTAWSRIG